MLISQFVSICFLAMIGQSFLYQPSGGLRQKIEAPVLDVYVPTGFDDNDIPQFIVEGEFPNACYQFHEVKLSTHKNEDTKKVHFYFFVEAYKLSDSECTEEKQRQKNVPYLEPVTLPMLAEGEYPIFHSQSREIPAGVLKIKKAPVKTQDDFVYAAVDSADIQPDKLKGGDFIFTLRGKFTNTCDDLDPEGIRIDPKTTRIIEVLPVVKRVRDQDCKDERVEFSRAYRLNFKLKPNRYLFHIRSADGRSKNFTVDVKEKDIDPRATEDDKPAEILRPFEPR